LHSIHRKKTRKVRVGDVYIGGDSPISVQSMTNTKTEDVSATVEQIKRLEAAGCEIVRVAVPTFDAADAIERIKREIRIPLVADIHFDFRLALKAIEKGADKVRINPGNIGSKERIREVLEKAAERSIPIRIGVNSGSLEKDILKKSGRVTASGLVESALRHIEICEDFRFTDIVVSIKSSDIPMMLEANRILSERVDYPIHLGVTEAGTPSRGILRSAVGIGALLCEGIGDTIRVSLTGDPVDEVLAGFDILNSCNLRKKGLTIISCPTCGRTRMNIVEIVENVESRLKGLQKTITVAIMGCEVNGPGEAREADIGIACGKGYALLFKKGSVVRKIKATDIVSILVDEVKRWSDDE